MLKTAAMQYKRVDKIVIETLMPA